MKTYFWSGFAFTLLVLYVFSNSSPVRDQNTELWKLLTNSLDLSLGMTSEQIGISCDGFATLGTCVQACNVNLLNHTLFSEILNFRCDYRQEYSELEECFNVVNETMESCCDGKDFRTAVGEIATSLTGAHRSLLLENMCRDLHCEADCEQQSMTEKCSVPERAKIFRGQFLEVVLRSSMQKLDSLHEAAEREDVKECENLKNFLDDVKNSKIATPPATTTSVQTATTAKPTTTTQEIKLSTTLQGTDDTQKAAENEQNKNNIGDKITICPMLAILSVSMLLGSSQ